MRKPGEAGNRRGAGELAGQVLGILQAADEPVAAHGYGGLALAEGAADADAAAMVIPAAVVTAASAAAAKSPEPPLSQKSCGP
jgi:hypothetical protein